MVKYFRLFIFIAMALIISCAEENPNLVNPPSQAETIRIRFLNFAGDASERKLSIDGKTTVSTPRFAVSDAITPPSDSGFVSIIKDGSPELKINRKLVFTRNITYNFIAFPSPDGSPRNKELDTLAMVQTSASIPENSVDAYIKLFNAFPDSTTRFSLRFGCPSGETLVSMLDYRMSSQQVIIRSGTVPVTLVQHEGPDEYIIGLYSLDLARKGQYLLIINMDANKNPELLMLDQANITTSALTKPQIIQDRLASVRLVNLSNSGFTFKKLPEEELIPSAAPEYISSFRQVDACGSRYKDQFAAVDMSASTIYSKDSISLEVLQKYTVVVYDSGSGVANSMIIAGPNTLFNTAGYNSIVRIINASSAQNAITVSLGARRYDSSASKYLSGETIATKLRYGKISQAVMIPSGPAPLTVFTAFEPSSLLYCTLAQFQSDKSYLVILTNDAQGKIKMTVIDEDDADKSVEYLEQGVFTQVVHAVAGLKFVDVTLGSILNKARIYYGSSIATVAPAGSNSININDKSADITAQADSRAMIVATAAGGSIEVHPLIYPPMGAESSNMKRKFLNFFNESKFITITEDPKDTAKAPIAERIEYSKDVPVETLILERRISLYFLDSDSRAVLKRLDDVLQPFGTNYSFILTGKSGADTTVIVQQEF